MPHGSAAGESVAADEARDDPVSLLHRYTSRNRSTGVWLDPDGTVYCIWWWDIRELALRVSRNGVTESWTPPAEIQPRVLEDLAVIARAMADQMAARRGALLAA